ITAQMRENLDDELTEVKSENAIDRITGQANPRTLERVPAGARFRTRLVMDVLCEEDAPLFLRVLEGLRLLEDDSLGGGGSRGSGRVSFANLRVVWRGKSHYASGAPEKEIAEGATLAAAQRTVTEAGVAFAYVKADGGGCVPVGIVEALLAGQTLDESHWTVDGPSACLMPAGRHGPFRTVVRWSAAVDRLSGASERHSTTCLEFRPGAGLWTIVSFADE